ncbi:single strand-specific nuclease, putative [Trypanosoma brucei gambiense DAL972]|uniref:Single strand-specific nuclease, putative n=1 Tax=Trypanosoma brucei gambiense (strain MHOM/CI/86/DAL972) TaxID=679716 RepID=C9ZQW0_TRYB9|nr:single strand-specific nuclease, putative [Trypanosoma brucei gambiense DAL972]CBH11790.1 single strand-specific nuclease, putative [Trypanosoma brucei gambiense DAL972]|eukprot:XP_011774075.1 single strand-specific nuclease, putative [Trypanosoma brucei gambiense DAL972]
MRGPVTILLQILLMVVIIFSSLPVDTWAAFGHMVVAEIAKRNLDADVLEKVKQYTQHLSESGPFPKIPDFVQSACWPDDLKSYDLGVMNGWHYTANVYSRDGFELKEPLQQKSNIVSVIDSLSATLSYHETPLYVRSFALAHLIHHYGDIHQPLHTTSQVSSEYKTGDLGGNLVHVRVRNTTTKLHSFWDDICRPSISMKRPLEEKHYAKVRSFADRLVETYDVSWEHRRQTNATIMSMEGFELAKEIAYAGVVNGSQLSSQYVDRCVETAEQRMTLAGYRLATHLNNILGSKPAAPAVPPAEGGVCSTATYGAILILGVLFCCHF